MFASIAKRYDLTNSVLSVGIHHLWRRELLSRIPKTGDPDRLSIDLCTGTGILLQALQHRGGRVIGADFCLPMLDLARVASHELVAPVVQSDAQQLPFPDQCADIITVAFGVRNLESLDRGLREMRRVLKPNGKLLVLEFGQPTGVMALPFAFYSRYLMPIIGGILTGNRSAYEYLPQTSKRFPCREAFLQIAKQVGFREGRFTSLSGGIAYLYELG